MREIPCFLCRRWDPHGRRRKKEPSKQNMNKYKCHFCTTCNGTGCIDQMPGMGGVNRNVNFRLNCDGWEVCRKENPLSFINFLERPVKERIPKIGVAPITGAIENIGWPEEKDWYIQFFKACTDCGLQICAGDGTPDEKLMFGIEAVKNLQKTIPETKATFFIKPFQNEKLLEHINQALPFASHIGIDIDSYNISTMQNLVPLEKKSAEDLLFFKDYVNSRKIPFVIKGVFTKEDIGLIKKVKPDVAYISNHGGRVETSCGSTAEFLQNFADELHEYSKEVWVDGGIRTPLDISTAMAFGADRVLIGRPFISAYCKGGADLLCKKVLELSLLNYSK